MVIWDQVFLWKSNSFRLFDRFMSTKWGQSRALINDNEGETLVA